MMDEWGVGLWARIHAPPPTGRCWLMNWDEFTFYIALLGNGLKARAFLERIDPNLLIFIASLNMMTLSVLARVLGILA